MQNALVATFVLLGCCAAPAFASKLVANLHAQIAGCCAGAAIRDRVPAPRPLRST